MTGTTSGRPLLSVAMWRLRPFGFFSPSSPEAADGTVSAALAVGESVRAAVGRGTARPYVEPVAQAVVRRRLDLGVGPAPEQAVDRAGGGDFAGGRAQAFPPSSTWKFGPAPGAAGA
jgi:hypothetical protein